MILNRLQTGVVSNSSADYEALLSFIHAIVQNHLTPEENEQRRLQAKRNERQEKLRIWEEEREKSLIVPPEPRYVLSQDAVLPIDGVLIRNYRKERQKQREEAHAAANLHLLAQFGLSLLHALLKRSFFDMKDPNQLSMLDPFASLLLASLKSHFNRITVRIRNIHTPATFFFFFASVSRCHRVSPSSAS
jgi:hypothetical protein